MYNEVAQVLDIPFSASMKSDAAGVAQIWTGLKAHTIAQGQLHTKLAQNYRTKPMADLMILDQSQRDFLKILRQYDLPTSNRSLSKLRQETQLHVEQLGTAVAAAKTKPSSLQMQQDPYILRNQISINVEKQLAAENDIIRNTLNLQGQCKDFEGKIIRSLQNVVDSHLQLTRVEAEDQVASAVKVNDTVHQIPASHEWDNFSGTSTKLLPADTRYRKAGDIVYTNKNHPTAQPLMEGYLLRKSKIRRNLKQHYYVLTPVGYLHEFERVGDEKPTMSLYIPECRVTLPSPQSVMPNFSIVGKRIGSLSTKTEFILRAESFAQADKWAEHLSKCNHNGISSLVASMGDGNISSAATPPDSVIERRRSSSGSRHSSVNFADEPVIVPATVHEESEIHHYDAQATTAPALPKSGLPPPTLFFESTPAATNHVQQTDKLMRPKSILKQGSPRFAVANNAHEHTVTPSRPTAAPSRRPRPESESSASLAAHLAATGGRKGRNKADSANVGSVLRKGTLRG